MSVALKKAMPRWFNHRYSLSTKGEIALGAVGIFTAAACIARLAVRRSRLIELVDKVAVITGGSRGLGLVLTRQLAEAGCKVAICARGKVELNRAEVDLRRHGRSRNILAIQCDLNSTLQIVDMVDRVRSHFGPIDILINNAGMIQVGPAEEMTAADFEEAMRLHFYAPLQGILAVVPEMKARGQGRIVNISSIGGKLPAPHLLPYTASKFALVGLSEGLRAELAGYGVYVTTVAPGLMRTGSPPNALFKGQNEKEYAWFAIADSLPFLSMSADRAARKIIRAIQYGDAEIILSMPAKLGARFHAMFPNISAEMAALADQWLPAPGGMGKRRVTGWQSRSPLAPSILTMLSDRASVRNNEVLRQ